MSTDQTTTANTNGGLWLVFKPDFDERLLFVVTAYPIENR